MALSRCRATFPARGRATISNLPSGDFATESTRPVSSSSGTASAASPATKPTHSSTSTALADAADVHRTAARFRNPSQPATPSSTTPAPMISTGRG